jgi:xanthine dehydrogenase accessory factor
MLSEEGFTAEELKRIRTPIGLDIGGTTPAEIALAILGEIVAVRHGRQA